MIVSFDSFSANSIGCYGNEWIETPNFDQLAATGIVFDRYFVDTLGPSAGLVWADAGSQTSLAATPQPKSLGHVMKAAGIDCQLITTLDLQEWQLRADFSTVRRVQGNDTSTAKPDEVSLARVVQAANEAWQELNADPRDRLLWLHAPGPGVTPQGFDELYFEDFEERGQSIVDLSETDRAQHPAVYAGSVSLFDHWLGVLFEQFCGAFDNQRLLLIVTSLRGYQWQHMDSTGHGAIRSRILGDQVARPPMLMKTFGDVRFADHASSRSTRFVQSYDLVPTLLDWFQIDGSPHKLQQNPSLSTAPNPSTDAEDSGIALTKPGRSLLQEITASVLPRVSVSFDDGVDQVAVRTEDWLCIQSRSAASLLQNSLGQHGKSDAIIKEVAAIPPISLFSKPEDIWDVDDISSQHPEVIAELLKLLPRHE